MVTMVSLSCSSSSSSTRGRRGTRPVPWHSPTTLAHPAREGGEPKGPRQLILEPSPHPRTLPDITPSG